MNGVTFDQFVVFVSVADLARAHDFYTDAVGLEMVLDQGQCRIYRVAAEAYLGLCDNPETAGATGGAIITLVTDRVDVVYDRLLASGVVVDHPPAYNPRFDIYHAFVRDPDGNRIEIQQFRDPRWPRPRE
jgi:catechol 2,3-dioxygenase-like lactoylglutathione lyase family enzyme